MQLVSCKKISTNKKEALNVSLATPFTSYQAEKELFSTMRSRAEESGNIASSNGICGFVLTFIISPKQSNPSFR